MSGISKRVSGSWVSGDYGIMKTATDTIATLPADLYPNDTTATVGISGNMEQNGTPTPDNPIMPQGTGERTGNLYNINAKDVNNGYVDNAQLNQDGTHEAWTSAEISEYIPISGDTAYTFNGIGSYNSPCYALYDENKQLIGAYKYSGRSTINFTSSNNARYFRFTHIKTYTQAMVVEGTYASSRMPKFEPYGYKIPILSANTTTPVYLGEVQSTRKIKKLVLTGNEGFAPYSFENTNGIIVANMLDSKYFRANGKCSHYPVSTSSVKNTLWIGVNNSNLYFVGILTALGIEYNQFASWVAQQYAAGTPVTIWYVLATSTTGIVNEPIRKIGDYADTVSGITIPTTTGANSFDVLTTLKPSEVTANYHGWHTGAVHERENGAWT